MIKVATEMEHTKTLVGTLVDTATGEITMTLSIPDTTELNAQHFADLIRVAQMIADPSGGLSGREIEVIWETFGVSPTVEVNLRRLGEKYQFSSPYLPPDVIWEQLLPATRTWLLENKRNLADLEEVLPARDED